MLRELSGGEISDRNDRGVPASALHKGIYIPGQRKAIHPQPRAGFLQPVLGVNGSVGQPGDKLPLQTVPFRFRLTDCIAGKESRFSLAVGPGGQILIPVGIDYSQDFGASNRELWDTEYTANIKAAEWLSSRTRKQENSANHDLTGYALPYDFIEELERMEPEERQFILGELAERSELLNEEEVMSL